MKRILFALLLIVLTAACSPSATGPDEPISATPGGPVNPTDPSDDLYAQQPGDAQLLRGNVYLDSAQLLVLESYPPQYRLALTGSLPDPCHSLRVQPAAPDAENRILVDVYALADPSAVCIQMLKPFTVSVPLVVDGLPAGHYTVWVDGEKVGEFDR
jgi:hypothetical protein